MGALSGDRFPATGLRMTSQALLLTPSHGRGGGIERYVETLEWAFAEQGVEYRRVDLSRSGPSAHARMLAQAREKIRASPRPTRLVLAHRALLPVAWLLAKGSAVCGISLVCHGNDVWGTRPLARRSLENRLMRGAGVRVVAVSSFTCTNQGLSAARSSRCDSRMKWIETELEPHCLTALQASSTLCPSLGPAKQ